MGMEPITLLGMACVIYVLAELSLAAGRCRKPARSAGFGAVDASTGRPIDVVLDRRRVPRRGRGARSDASVR